MTRSFSAAYAGRVPIELQLADAPPPERADAARNREAILAAALRLVEARGVGHVTMDTVAAEAGVGKGTVFRRFDTREGLMAAVLNTSETQWQASVISGPPPLGPGAPAMERLLAFGHSRLRTNLTHASLIEAAGRAGARSVAAMSFANMHVRYLEAGDHDQGRPRRASPHRTHTTRTREPAGASRVLDHSDRAPMSRCRLVDISDL